MQLGLGLASGGAAGPVGHLIDIDFPAGRFRFGDRLHAGRDAFLADAGGSASGHAMILGPTFGGPELLADGGFDAGALDGWASTPAYAGLGSVAVADNVLVAAIDSSSGVWRCARANAVQSGRAYRFRADLVAKSSTPPLNALSINVSNNLDLGGSDARFANFGVGVPPQQTLEVVAGSASATLYTGFVLSATASQPASAALDDLSLREVLPYPGFVPGGFAFRLTATTAASLSGNRVALQWGTDGERFRVRLVWDAAGQLRLVVTSSGAEQANLDLGSVAPSTPFTVMASIGPNRVVARRDAGTVAIDRTVNVPAIGRLWIGRSFSGEAWSGSLDRLAVWAAERVPAGAVLLEGDSYVSGAGGVGLATALVGAGLPVIATASGGSALAAILARIAANPGLAAGALVLWDGEMGAGAMALEQLPLYAAIAELVPHGRFLFLPPLRRANRSSADNAEVAALQLALAESFPGHVLAVDGLLAAAATLPGDAVTLAAGHVPASLLQADQTHLTAPAMSLVADAVAAELVFRGWLA